MSFINNLWYGKTLSSYLFQLPLLPFSGIFAVIAAARRSIFSNGLCSTSGPVVPVVVIGGITAGGTGKTPLCIALVRELKARGYHPGVLSRGYKSHCKTVPCQVPLKGLPEEFGDEPCLIRRATQVPVVIDPKRTRGADYLAGLGVDVIVTDDGLQHYQLDRDVEVCVLDGSRMMGNGHLLPAGPLREAKWRLKTVDSIVVTGAVAHLGYFPMMFRQTSITPLNPSSQETLQNKSKVCAVAGIGNPDRFYKSLEDCGFIVEQRISLGDHARMSLEKLKKLAMNMPVVMTSKDAIKYQNDADDLFNVFVFNINAQLSKQFYDDVVNKIKQANYKVSQRKKRREAEGYVLEKIEAVDAEEIAKLEAAEKLEREAKLAEEAAARHAKAAQDAKEEEAAYKAVEAATLAMQAEVLANKHKQAEAERAKALAAEAKAEATREAVDKELAAGAEPVQIEIKEETPEASATPAALRASKRLRSKNGSGVESERSARPFEQGLAEDDSRPLFGKKKDSRPRFDPQALPRELKRKTKKTEKADAPAAAESSATAEKTE